jgi:hypothetical protein
MANTELFEPVSYNRVQHSFTAGGDHIVLRGDTGEEVEAAAQSYAEYAEGILKAVNMVKQAIVATGVFTGDSTAKTVGSASKERAADTPPPTGGDEAPECLHGPMTDMSGRGFKKRWYCPERGKDKKCWAKD